MNLESLMTPHPACCTPETPVADVATMMKLHDCGEIPVVASTTGLGLVGVVTDRDIVLRLVAQGEDIRQATAANCMTQPAVSLPPDAKISDAIELMQAHQLRRLPIVNGDGQVCGIVAQADLARWATSEQTGDLVRDVSEPKLMPNG